MERDRLVQWLFALGIGFLMFSVTLFLFLTYRFTDEAYFTMIVCMIIGIILCVGGFALSREWSGPRNVTSRYE